MAKAPMGSRASESMSKRRSGVKRRTVRISFWLWCSLACLASAEVGVQDVTDALARMEQRKPTDWAYTQIATTKKMEAVARYDPRLPGATLGWTLLRMNGDEPSKKEARKFYRKIEKQAERAEKAGDTAPVLAELIQYDSLVLQQVGNTGQAVFSFLPMIEGLEDRLSGELVFHEGNQRIESLRVWNRGDYSPTFSVTVTAFSLSLNFGAFGSDTVLTQMVSKVKGTIGFLKKVDETAQVEFTDYELLAESP